MSKVGFGFIYDFRNLPAWQRPPAQLYGEMIDAIVKTERMGFAAAWLPEHHVADDGYVPSPLTVLAALAARTETMTLGSAIAIAPLYDPLRFAEDCAVIDCIAGGRLEMGLAIGYRRREYEAFGLDFSKRGARFEEFLTVVRRLWAGETVTHAGQHFTLTNASIAPLPPRGQVPLYIGGFAPKAIERVARHGDGYYGNAEVWPLMSEKLLAAGRKPEDFGILIPAPYTFIARDKDAALEELAPHYHAMHLSYGAWMNEDNAIGLESARAEEMDLETFRASGVFDLITPDEAIARYQKIADAMPLKHVAMTWPPGLSPERFLAYASDIAEDVIPRFS
ncbi:MAG: LLM class flavin-dependent oxidoreductase [Sphingomonadaceae bacterium]